VNETVEQLAIADRVIINKIDLVTQDQLADLEKQIQGVNGYAQLFRTEYSRVADLKQILAIQAFDVDRWVSKGDAHYLDYRPNRTHDSTIVSVCLAGEGALDKNTFDEWLGNLLQTKKSEILRTKALVHIKDKKERYVYQGVHALLDSSPRSEWEADEKRYNRLLFIGRNINGAEIAQSFESTMNPTWAATVPKPKGKAPIYLAVLSGPGSYERPPPAANILGLLIFLALIVYFLFFGN